MHLGYGGGFLAGLVRFARRWGERSEAPPPRRGLHAVATEGGLMDGSAPRRVVFIGGLDDGRRAVQELLGASARRPRRRLRADRRRAGAGSQGSARSTTSSRRPCCARSPRCATTPTRSRRCAPTSCSSSASPRSSRARSSTSRRLGVIGFHTAVLPGRRGSSPVIWAMVEGLDESGVTMFYMDEGIDTGDVIAVERFPIDADDYAADVLRKADDATLNLLRAHLDADPRRHGAAHPAGRRPAAPTPAGAPGRRGDRLEQAGAGDRQPGPGPRRRPTRSPTPSAATASRSSSRGPGWRRSWPCRPPAPPQDPLRQRVLCVVAHPDDETLGVGGTLALHAEAGSEVTVLIMSEGEVEKLSSTPRCDTRRECALRAAEAMGVVRGGVPRLPGPAPGHRPVHRADQDRGERPSSSYRPTVVYAHHGGDANTDHQVVFKAVYAACRPMTPLGSLVQRFLTFETPSSTDQAPQVADYVFNPTTFVDVEPVWDKKLKALACYPTRDDRRQASAQLRLHRGAGPRARGTLGLPARRGVRLGP